MAGPPPVADASPEVPLPVGADGGAVPYPARTPARPTSPFFADHAISIVLYLGAFLIVTSVAIFLAYSWGDIQGEAKLGLLMAGHHADIPAAA